MARLLTPRFQAFSLAQASSVKMALSRPSRQQVTQADNGLIALFEFEETKEGIKVSSEKHYRLVRPDELSSEELESYRIRTP